MTEKPVISFSKSFILDQLYLSDLLPYDASKKNRVQLQISLKEYQMILSASLEAVNALDVLDLQRFDALVGENACQIRTAWIAMIASKKTVNTTDLRNQITSLKKKIDALLEEEIVSKLMRSKISLLHLLVSNKLLLPLSSEELFVIQCFLLSEAKTTTFNEILMSSISIRGRHDTEKLKKFGNVSSKFAEKLIRKTRKLTARVSVQFIREIAKNSHDKNLIKMVSDEFSVYHNNHLLCTPMFWTYKSILLATKKEKIPLIIQVKFLNPLNEKYEVIGEDCLFFRPDPNPDTLLQNLVNKNFETPNPSKVAWVVQGVAVLPKNIAPDFKARWRQKFLSHSVNSIILAGAADHRQYPNPEQDKSIYMLQDHEYETYKSFAKSEGFSLDNPETFLIQHVHASKTESIFSRDILCANEAGSTYDS